MLRLPIGRASDCQALSRRQFLQVGAVGAFGLTLSGLLRSRAAAGAASRKDISCILLWMSGGPSHHETFDPKPDAPDRIRGEFRPIRTAIPGVHFGEHLPRMAAIAGQYALLRSLNPRNGSHGTADAYMMSGHAYAPAMTYPCYGSVISQQRGDRRGMPPFLQLGNSVSDTFGGGTAGFLGNTHNPYVVPGDPNEPTFSVRDVTPPRGVSLGRVERRLEMLRSLDRWQEHMDRSDAVTSMDTFYDKARSLLTAPETRRAFDLSMESHTLRDAYGRTTLGQSCLLARRLIEAGVRFVTVSDGGWDTHGDNFNTLKNKRLPPLDRAYPALLQDLKDRGLLETTLVVWMGDFGRTPQINGSAGRDHWASVGNVIFAGAGVRPGVVVGATDREGGGCVRDQYFTEDVAATLYQQLGIPRDTTFTTSDGRPIHFWVGRTITEII
jgi:uncharacterized protein (DUF1501 family)